MRLWLCLLLAAAQLAAPHGHMVHQQSPLFHVAKNNTKVDIVCEVKTSPANTRIYWLRRLQAPSTNSQYEFLAVWKPKEEPVYSQNVGPEELTVKQTSTQIILSLKSVKPADSGVYFCMTIGNPELTFGKGTQLNVVDVLPTTAKPTKKTTPKKRRCQPFPSPATPKGPLCGPLPLGLLVTGAVILLVSLAVSIHLYCLRRRAQLRFMKKFYK
ncbi:T-cell surface glycoprotein CD8 beta chain [Sturnira hondurensis]|uniref:T-cell surface glycoprotein CD8 beta chain n=1 Tax=Sturnira hondurensis TaxID=192404 RepID=UPI00187954C4|nr:T-cell surface glycoprotein CD8 beta chain [Sturnira hondurensis]